MKLPLDNFQLLGASLGMEPHNILTVLEKRLEKSRYVGFSQQTLTARKRILLEASQTLLKPEIREEYEKEITKTPLDSNVNGIVISPESQIAGLLLLLEAGEAEKCLTLAYNEYKDSKYRIGDNEEKHLDLLLVIDYATLEYAKRLKEDRFYESSASIIERRIRSNDIRASSKELKRQMEKELERLTPYRVLDLISRESSEKSHTDGIRILEGVVKERGGLENDSDRYMKNEEFKAFFRQIRMYLTVQEQIDLYKQWADLGSRASAFLAGIALVASGFVQRKPEKMVEALEIIKNIKSDELEPVLANIYLLLGDIRNAEDLFNRYADEALKEWSKGCADDTLGRLCCWCREWLSRDVLPGYRDIDAEANLEAYFSDRDVAEYLESIEDLDKKDGNEIKAGDKSKWLVSPMESVMGRFSWQERNIVTDQIRVSRKRIDLVRLRSGFQGLKKHEKVQVGIIGLTVATGLIFIGLNRNEQKQNKSYMSSNERRVAIDNRKRIKENVMGMSNIYSILGKYHTIKREILSGGSVPSDSEDFLSRKAVERILNERSSDQRKGETQVIDVGIKEIRIKERTDSRILLEAALDYGDKRLNRNRKIISQTPRHSFERMYTLIKNGNKWVVE